MKNSIELRVIEADGRVRGFDGELNELALAVCEATLANYGRVGFDEPWVGYIACKAGVPIGTCGFKAPIAGGRVEIAYFTFPENEGRGVATKMASQLVRIAEQHPAKPIVVAQTLPERNASHRVLEKLGFVNTGILEHEEDGIVIEWRRDG